MSHVFRLMHLSRERSANSQWAKHRREASIGLKPARRPEPALASPRLVGRSWPAVLKWVLLPILLLLCPPSLADSATDDDSAQGGINATLSADEAPLPTIDPAMAPVVERDHVLQVSVGEELARLQYRFCNDPAYRLWQEDKNELCPYLDDFDSTCPGLRAACGRPAWETEMQEREDDDWDLRWLSDFLESLGPLMGIAMKIVFWGLLAVGVLFIARAIARQLRQNQSDKDDSNHVIVQATQVARPEPVETRASVLLEQCRAALAEGRDHDALHLAYRAVICGLADAHLVSVHRSRTSGEYLRTLRGIQDGNQRQRDAQQATELIRNLDRARFTQAVDEPLTRSLASRAAALVQRLSPLAAILLAFLVVGCDPPAIPEPPHAPTAPRGYSVLQELIATRAVSVHRRLRRVTTLPEDTSTVLALSPSLKPLEWENLHRFVMAGGHLVVAGEAEGFAEEFGVALARGDCNGPLSLEELDLRTLDQHRGVDIHTPRDLVASCGSTAFAVSAYDGAGMITLVGDSHLFENARLAAADNASLAFHLLGDIQNHVELIGPWTGRGSMNPLESISRAGLLPWLGHLLLLLALWAWARGRRFGMPVDPPEKKRRAFSDHALALAHHYERKGAAGVALQHYAEWVLDELRRRAPSGKNETKALSKVLAKNSQEEARLRHALTTARRADQLGSSHKDLLATFRALRGALRQHDGASRKPSRDR